jgi:Rrf2 family protein
MKTSTKARYSLRLMIDIAQNDTTGPVSLTDVSRRQNVSVKYLEQLAKALSAAYCLISIRGSQGGYRLARPAREISAGEVIRAAEGDFTPVACLGEEDEGCPLADNCTTSQFWAGLRDAIDDYADSVSLAELATL